MGRAQAWWPAVVIAAAIFLASSTAGSALPGRLPPGADKVAHLMIYGLLGAAVARAIWGRSGNPTLFRVAIWATVVSALYGLSDEAHQLFVPGRSFEIWDLVADAFGALVGAALFLKARRRRQVSPPA
jgi:VanZ family protein